MRSALRVVSGAALLTCTSACATALFVPPVGPGDPAPDAAAAWAEATRACRGVTSYKGSLRVSGRIRGDRLPTIGIATGATATGIRIEGQAAGRSIFTLAGTADLATLYLDDGHRSATGRPEDLTDALMGVKLEPARWLALLTGCVATPPADVVAGARYGPDLAVNTSSGRVFLTLANGAWRAVHGTFDGLVVTYGRFASSLPAEWRLSSEAGRDPSVDLAVSVDDMTAGSPIAPLVFTVALPPDATPMTLDELRQSGPLRRKGE